MKKITYILIILTVILNVYIMSAEAKAEVKTGVCGDNATYTLDDNGLLTISGEGSITKVFIDDLSIRNSYIDRIVVEEGITELGEDCFYFFDEVTEIELPSTLSIIGKFALCNNMSLKELSLPNKLTSIGKSAFKECEALEEIYIPDSVTSIEPYAFVDCGNLAKVRLPKNLDKIEDYLFDDCIKLTEVIWPENLKSIGVSSFRGCNSLQNIKVPDTVEVIGGGAFEDCDNLTELTLGTSLKSVRDTYGEGSLALRRIINNSSISVALDNSNKNITWYVDGEKSDVLPPCSKAKAKAKKYKITYELNNGKGKLQKKHEYGIITKLPTLYRKGYTHIGWYVYQNKSWDIIYKKEIDAKAKGKIIVKAVFRKVKVSSQNRRIKVSVTYPGSGNKKSSDAPECYYMYSENPDMTNATMVNSTAPYGKGLSKKLKKGKTYYVRVTEHISFMQEDDEDYLEPAWGWFGTWKVKIK